MLCPATSSKRRAHRCGATGIPCSKAILAIIVAGALLPAAAQEFVNLDFEQARVPVLAPGELVLLPWPLAAPGWGHSTGDSTDTVAYPVGHLGFSQSYVLRNGAEVFGAQGGSFAMSFRGGTLNEHAPRGDWVQAFIAQSGIIPAGTGALQLLSSSFQFQVLIDGMPLDMQPIGLDPALRDSAFAREHYVGPWAGDISFFGGRLVDMRIMETFPAGDFSGVLAIDDIRLLPVPELPTGSLLAAGLLVLAFRRRSPAPRWPNGVAERQRQQCPFAAGQLVQRRPCSGRAGFVSWWLGRRCP
jgi:hypothetical protein